jgi:hypothetical protein
MDFATKRAEAEAELENLRVLRGQCILDGEQFEAQQRINQLTHFLEGLSAAEGVSAERQRAAAEARRLQHLAELRSELAGLWAEYQLVTDLTEMAARNYKDGIDKILLLNARMLTVAHAISDGPSPAPLFKEALVERLAGRLSGLLSTIKGYHHRFGNFVWFSVGLYPANQSWTEKEKRLLAPHLEPLIAGATPKAKEAPLMITHVEKKEPDPDDADASSNAAA